MRERLPSSPVLAGIGVSAGALALYLSTIAPTLTWGYLARGVDGGELLAAANTFGVPHPPGYPTYTLLLKLFATLVPVGDFAFRGNLMSALLATGSVALLYAVVLRFCGYMWPNGPRSLRTVSAALGAGVFAASPLFWSQAIITEVHTLNALFAGLLLLIATRLALPTEPRGEGSPRNMLVLFGLVLGLGLGNHLTLLAIAVPLALWVAASLGWRNVASVWPVLALFVGLSIYVYLPISASQEPAVNWGNADTVGGMAWMLSGRVYQEHVFGVSSGAIGGRVRDWADLSFDQFNPIGIFLGLVGAASLRTRQRWFLAASLASIAVVSVYSITFNTIDASVLTIPAFMVFSIWIGVGFYAVISSFSEWASSANQAAQQAALKFVTNRTVLALSIIGALAMPISSVVLNHDDQNLRSDRRAFEYAKTVIDSVPDGSVVVSARETTAFSMWYMRYAEETDRDVAPIASPLLQFDWYWRNLNARFPDRFPADGPTDIALAVKRIVEHNDGRADVYFTYMDALLPGVDLEQITQLGPGPLYKASLRAAP